MKRIACLAVALVVLGGCATLEQPAVTVKRDPAAAQPAPRPPEPVPPVATVTPAQQPALPAPVVAPPAPVLLPAAKPGEVETLLAEFERVRKLPVVELVREQEAARQAFNATRSDPARVRLALTLAVPGYPGAEDGRALELLEPLVRAPGASLHSLAFLLHAYIHEQRRLTNQVQGLQHNVQALQQKLDALRTLERSLTEREPARRR